MEVRSENDELAVSAAPGGEIERLTRENAELRAELERRILAESELRASEAKFRELVETMPQFVWTCDAQGLCDYLGPQWLAYTGTPENSQLGEGWLRHIHPDDLERVKTAWTNSASAGAAFDIDFRIQGGDGSYRWFKTRALPSRDSEGRICRWLGTNTDIQELRQAEQEVRRLSDGLEQQVLARTRELESVSERLLAATTAAQIGIWERDLVHDTVSLDPRMSELLGFDRHEFSGSAGTWRSVMHPEDTAATMDIIARALVSDQRLDVRYRVRLPQGKIRHLHSAASIFRDAGGKPLRLLGASWDVTGEVEAQARLKTNEARWDLALQGNGDGVWDYDLAKDEIFLSQRSKELLGDSREEVTDSKFREGLVHPEDLAGVQDEFKRHVSGETPLFECEYRIRCRDDSYRWILARGRVIAHSAHGAPLRIVGTHRDIAERRRAQDALRNQEALLEAQNRQLASSNAELEQFAYVASHDLQEPLRAVAGCTQILAKRYKGRLDAEADTLVEHIVDGASRMKALIEDLLSLSRLSSQSGTPRQVDTTAAFNRALANLQGRIQEQGARVSAGPLPAVRGDFTQLVQLFQNLIGNALKYRQPDRTPEVRVTATPSTEGGHEFRIQDNGIGIEARYFERIFGVFQRLHTRAEYPGTGIGLALCRKIVEHHGGKLWLESTVGLGSTFHFSLPR